VFTVRDSEGGSQSSLCAPAPTTKPKNAERGVLMQIGEKPRSEHGGVKGESAGKKNRSRPRHAVRLIEATGRLLP